MSAFLKAATLLVAIVLSSGCGAPRYEIFTMTQPDEAFRVEGRGGDVVGVHGPLLVSQWRTVIDAVYSQPDTASVEQCVAHDDGVITVLYRRSGGSLRVASGRLADGRYVIESTSAAAH